MTSLRAADAILLGGSAVDKIYQGSQQSWPDPATPPPAGSYVDEIMLDTPLGYWPLQEVAGTVAADSSGYARDASFVNGVVLADASDPAAPAALGNHVRFDGSDDHILLPAGTWLAAGDGFSFEGWFYFKTWENWNRIFDFADGTNITDLALGSNNVGSMYVGANGTNYNFAPRFTLAKWQHIVLTMSAAGAVVIYVDGAQYASFNASAPVSRSRAFHYVGKAAYPDPAPDFSVTQLAVYPGVLSAARVLAHHDAGDPPPPPLETQAYDVEVLADAPLAYYRLNDTGAVAADSSGNARDLTFPGSSTVVKGAAGLLDTSADTAMDFPGSGNGYLSRANATFLDGLTEFTAEAWFKFDQVNNDRVIVARTNWESTTADVTRAFHMLVKNGVFTISVTGGGGGVEYGGGAVVAGTRYHAVMVYAGGRLKGYLNNAKVIDIAAAYGAMRANSSPLTVGSANPLTWGLADGVIDEVALYGVALSETRIDYHYQAGT